MEIINFEISDVKKYHTSIVDLLKQSFLQSFPNELVDFNNLNKKVDSLETYINENKAVVYGYLIKGELAGIVWFFEKSYEEIKAIHINHFVVQEKFRRLGIGEFLWSEVENFVSKNGINEIDLLVTKNNEDAVNFYSKRNFEVERFVMKKRF